MRNWLTLRSQPDTELDLNLNEHDFEPELPPQAKPVQAYKGTGSVLLDYDKAILNQLQNLRERELELKNDIAQYLELIKNLELQVLENQATQHGLDLARKSWAQKLPKQQEDHNADAIQRAIDAEVERRRNGTEATPTGESLPVENG